jgi:hypothetical protein
MYRQSGVRSYVVLIMLVISGCAPEHERRPNHQSSDETSITPHISPLTLKSLPEPIRSGNLIALLGKPASTGWPILFYQADSDSEYWAICLPTNEIPWPGGKVVEANDDGLLVIAIARVFTGQARVKKSYYVYPKRMYGVPFTGLAPD